MDDRNKFEPCNRFIGDIDNGLRYPYGVYLKDEVYNKKETDEKFSTKEEVSEVDEKKADKTEVNEVIEQLNVKADKTEIESIQTEIDNTKSNVNPNLNLIASVLVEKYDSETVLQHNGNPQSVFVIEHGVYGVIAIDATDDSTKGETDGIVYEIDTINQRVLRTCTIEKCRHANSAIVVDNKLYVSRSWDAVICVYDMLNDYRLINKITINIPNESARVDSIAYTGEKWVVAVGHYVYQSDTIDGEYTLLFEMPMSYPLVSDNDMFRVGTLSFSEYHDCFYISGTTPNFLSKVDKSGKLIASYNTDTAFAEPEQCCFDDDLIIMLMYNNLSTHRMIDLYAISESKPFPAWRSPQWGLDYLFVDTETTSLMRDGSFGNPFKTIDEIFLYYKAENVRDIKFKGTLNNAIFTSKNIRVHKWDNDSIAVFNKVTIESSSCMFFGCTFNKPDGSTAAIVSRAATTILEDCTFTTNGGYAITGNGAVAFNNSTPYSLTALFDGSIVGNNARTIINERIQRNAGRLITYANYINANEFAVDERKLGEFVVLDIGANSGHHTISYRLANIATGNNISVRFPFYSSEGFALYACNLNVSKSENQETGITEYKFKLTKASAKDVNGEIIENSADIKILYAYSM